MTYNIAILTHDDSIWSPATWSRTIPLLKKDKKIKICGLWVCDEKLANLKKNEIKKWYLKVFGGSVFLLLGIFFIIFRVKVYIKYILLSTPRSVREICKTTSIPHYSIMNPNNKELSDWIINNEIDILIIMTSYVITEPLLSAPKVGIINKHAALLPANRGLFPFLWAKLKDEEQGFTFHKVIKNIDSGTILYQEKVPSAYSTSMVKFYFYVYKNFGSSLIKSFHILIGNKKSKIKTMQISSYQSLPTKQDYKKFLRKHGSIVTIRDLFLAFKL